ncbi:MAG: DUF5320 domain-containing protein [Bacteroidales bacterium]|nr:DUF5320 domain-containing protein [Bacteroidales bacterium]
MPNFDKTGPMGQGPMTGRRMGNCSGNNPENSNFGFGGRGRGGRGMGRGAGKGFARGRGRGFGFRNQGDINQQS